MRKRNIAKSTNVTTASTTTSRLIFGGGIVVGLTIDVVVENYLQIIQLQVACFVNKVHLQFDILEVGNIV